jgi:hypothetical protein
MERIARSPRVPGNRPQPISRLNLAGVLAVLLAAIGTAPAVAQNDDSQLRGRADASPEAIAFAQRGLILTQQHRLDEARIYNRGIARGESGDKDGAIADYREALNLRPGMKQAADR